MTVWVYSGNYAMLISETGCYSLVEPYVKAVFSVSEHWAYHFEGAQASSDGHA